VPAAYKFTDPQALAALKDWKPAQPADTKSTNQLTHATD